VLARRNRTVYALEAAALIDDALSGKEISP
jgi:hypothetical protein